MQRGKAQRDEERLDPDDAAAADADLGEDIVELPNTEASIRGHLFDALLLSLAKRPGYTVLDSSLPFLCILDPQYVQHYVETVTAELKKGVLVFQPINDFQHACLVALQQLPNGKVKGRHYDTYPSAVNPHFVVLFATHRHLLGCSAGCGRIGCWRASMPKSLKAQFTRDLSSLSRPPLVESSGPRNKCRTNPTHSAVAAWQRSWELLFKRRNSP